MKIAPLVMLVALATGCATEVVDSGEPTSTIAATTTTLPSGPPAELLPQLVVTLRAVSEAIIDEGDQRALLAEAEGLWSAAKPEVAATDADTAEEMEGMMDIARLAVERSRPADADKAAKFLESLVDHYLEG